MVRHAGADGFSSVTLDRLADAAGVEPDVAARHVDSLDQLLADAYADAVDRLYELYARAFAAQDSWVARFEAGAAAVLEIYALDPELARVCSHEVLKAGPAARAAQDAAHARLVEFATAELAKDIAVPPVHIELVCGAITQAFADELGADGRAEAEVVTARAAAVAAMFEPAAPRLTFSS